MTSWPYLVAGIVLGVLIGQVTMLCGFRDFSPDEWREFRDDDNSDAFERGMATVALWFHYPGRWWS